MSLRTDGKYRCDRCDIELENGGVHESAVVATIIDGAVVTLHFGREEGCERKVLSNRNLAGRLEAKDLL